MSLAVSLSACGDARIMQWAMHATWRTLIPNINAQNIEIVRHSLREGFASSPRALS